MSKIIKTYNAEVVKRTARRCKARGIVIPTFHQMRHPETAPEAIKARLKTVGLWDVDPANLFRITWKNDPETGLFGDPNHLEIPSAITGVKARIIGLVGKYFPTGAHKVGAAFACLVPRLVSGEFDPDYHKAVWPSTGNYCRGGAFDSAVLGCTAIAILPENMSQERFTWLAEIGSEVIATPGCESNVKEIYDKCWELKNDPRHLIFNQFEEFGNPVWHYNVTGPAIEDVYNGIRTDKTRLAGYVSATGSAGTIAAGDYLKSLHPGARTIATEALQCPTLLMNGFGDHRIEGIGTSTCPGSTTSATRMPWQPSMTRTACASSDSSTSPQDRPTSLVSASMRPPSPAWVCWASAASATSWRPSRWPSTSNWTRTT